MKLFDLNQVGLVVLPAPQPLYSVRSFLAAPKQGGGAAPIACAPTMPQLLPPPPQTPGRWRASTPAPYPPPPCNPRHALSTHPPSQDGTLTSEELLRSLALDGAVDDDSVDAGVVRVGRAAGGPLQLEGHCARLGGAGTRPPPPRPGGGCLSREAGRRRVGAMGSHGAPCRPNQARARPPPSLAMGPGV